MVEGSLGDVARTRSSEKRREALLCFFIEEIERENLLWLDDQASRLVDADAGRGGLVWCMGMVWCKYEG